MLAWRRQLHSYTTNATLVDKTYQFGKSVFFVSGPIIRNRIFPHLTKL